MADLDLGIARPIVTQTTQTQRDGCPTTLLRAASHRATVIHFQLDRSENGVSLGANLFISASVWRCGSRGESHTHIRPIASDYGGMAESQLVRMPLSI